MNINIVFWWNIPCRGIISVFEEFSKLNDGETKIITGKLSDSRISMGWSDVKSKLNNRITLLPGDYGTKDEQLLMEFKDYIHVFGGIVHPNYVGNLIKLSIANKISFFNMSESYCNMDYSWKRNLKNVYYKFIYPQKHKYIAKHSLGVFSLSGGSVETLKKFRDCYWKESSIFPFGYYTNENTIDFKENKEKQYLDIICPGLLEKYKGVSLLISAGKKLLDKGVDNFKIHITGKGREADSLKNQVRTLGLRSNVIFHGTLSDLDYVELQNKIDVLVAPGLSEPWGIRVNEAIQNNLVVIVSDGLGASSLIKESKGGKVFRSGDVDELAMAMEYYLTSKANVSQAKKNNNLYKSKINPKTKAMELISIFNKCL